MFSEYTFPKINLKINLKTSLVNVMPIKADCNNIIEKKRLKNINTFS